MKNVEPKVALITGAGTGIGQAIAARLARSGFRLAVTDLVAETAEATVRTLEQPDMHRAWPLNVTDATSIQDTVAAVTRQLGPISVLCNNAGVSTMNHFWALSEDEWNLNIDVNLKGVWQVTRHVVPDMIERKMGKIIVTASMAAKMGAPLLAHYSASKFGVVGLVQAMAKELAPYGITCNAVCPGFVKTSMQDREIVWEAALRGIAHPEAVRDEYVSMTPLGRLCTPNDVASVVNFLASSDADFMTGQALNVTGGACMH